MIEKKVKLSNKEIFSPTGIVIEKACFSYFYSKDVQEFVGRLREFNKYSHKPSEWEEFLDYNIGGKLIR